jgi:hypothetical protein
MVWRATSTPGRTWSLVHRVRGRCEHLVHHRGRATAAHDGGTTVEHQDAHGPAVGLISHNTACADVVDHTGDHGEG